MGAPLYQDIEFACDVRDFIPSNHQHYISWMRPHEIREKPTMVQDDFSVTDIKDYHFQTLSLQAGCAAVVSNKKLMKHVVVDHGAPLYGDGYTGGPYHFQFFHNGKWTQVSVDDRLPCLVTHLMSTQSRHEDEFWVALLEKAYAKLHGGYVNIKGGHACDALTELTGGISMSTEIKGIDDKEVWHNADETSRFVCLSAFSGTERRDNIIPDHLYAVIGSSSLYYSVEDRHVRLVKLYNTKGGHEYYGPWGLRGKEWDSVDDETKEAIGYDNRENGVFFIEDSAIPDLFEQVHSCLPSPEFQSDEPESRPWKQVELGLDECVLLEAQEDIERVICSFLQCVGGQRLEFNEIVTTVFELPGAESETGRVKQSKSVARLEVVEDFPMERGQRVAITVDVNAVCAHVSTESIVARIAAEADLEVNVLKRSELHELTAISKDE